MLGKFVKKCGFLGVKKDAGTDYCFGEHRFLVTKSSNSIEIIGLSNVEIMKQPWFPVICMVDAQSEKVTQKYDPKWRLLKDGDFHLPSDPNPQKSTMQDHSFVVSTLHLVEFVLPEAIFCHWKNPTVDFSNLVPVFCWEDLTTRRDPKLGCCQA